MSQKRYKNPVNDHFIYNDEIRKSTCKVCYFDMAGRHSENLMRHLKRKHPATYADVRLEKLRRRYTANPNQSGSDTGPLSSMFKFETEPHKLFIKSEKLVFRLDEPGQQQTAMSEACSNEFEDEDAASLNAHSQFESLDIGKEELREELDQSSGQLHDSSDSPNDESPFIMATCPEQQAPASLNNVALASVKPETVAPAANPANSQLQVAQEDASYLQHLGYKFSKYNSNTKNTVQYHINCILYKADMGCYDNADASKLPDS